MGTIEKLAAQRAGVKYANDNEITLVAPALWIADQLRAAGFRHVDVNNQDVLGLLRTFRWASGLPID